MPTARRVLNRNLDEELRIDRRVAAFVVVRTSMLEA
jgi:hypothetical protein